MGEREVVENSKLLRTRETIGNDLRKLGLQEGMTVLVHSSLSSFGWVCGGPVAVVQALMDVITEKGTIIMPAHTRGYSDPSNWGRPAVPEEWWQPIRDTMPAYNPRFTPTGNMGAIAETFRTFEGVLRSDHPAVSFTSWGKNAAYITENHSLAFSLGEDSPLARIYDLDGWVLLAGVGHGNNTSLHLAENRAAGASYQTAGAPIMENGNRVWREYQDIDFETDSFEELGEAFEGKIPVIKGLIGSSTARLFKQRACVDFGKEWLETKRR